MLTVYESLALAQTAQIWQSVKKSQVARTRAKAKRLNTEQCQDGWTHSGAEVDTLAEKNKAKTKTFPPTVSTYDAIRVSQTDLYVKSILKK